MTVKVIMHTGECAQADDPGLPFRFYANLRPPGLMEVSFCLLYGGSEEIVARSDDEAELRTWIKTRQLDTHPRLRRWSLTGPNGVIEEHDRERSGSAGALEDVQ